MEAVAALKRMKKHLEFKMILKLSMFTKTVEITLFVHVPTIPISHDVHTQTHARKKMEQLQGGARTSMRSKSQFNQSLICNTIITNIILHMKSVQEQPSNLGSVEGHHMPGDKQHEIKKLI